MIQKKCKLNFTIIFRNNLILILFFKQAFKTLFKINLHEFHQINGQI